MSKVTYKDAGVNLDEYEKAMQRLPRLMHRTHTPRVRQLDGGFAGLFQLDFASRLFSRAYQNPVMVACTDGVGTKLKVATSVGRHDSVGIDLVAMCVNDAICCGAEPLFFLDYIAMDRDDPERLESIVQGISDGCLQAGTALLGGETAIMPDLYSPGEYDLAGFCVGVAEKDRVIDGSDIQHGDAVVGISSNGLHSNGFSLARKIVFEIAGLSHDTRVDELGCTVAEELLKPTSIYVNLVRDILGRLSPRTSVKGLAHITGGGLRENLARILPVGLGAELDRYAWSEPPVFGWLKHLGDVDEAEMERVFNCGIGFVAVVRPSDSDVIQEIAVQHGFACSQLGTIATGDSVNWCRG